MLYSTIFIDNFAITWLDMKDMTNSENCKFFGQDKKCWLSNKSSITIALKLNGDDPKFMINRYSEAAEAYP